MREPYAEISAEVLCRGWGEKVIQLEMPITLCISGGRMCSGIQVARCDNKHGPRAPHRQRLPKKSKYQAWGGDGVNRMRHAPGGWSFSLEGLWALPFPFTRSAMVWRRGHLTGEFLSVWGKRYPVYG